MTTEQESRAGGTKLQIRPKKGESLKIDPKILRHGTQITFHALIDTNGKMSNLDFVSGNRGLMPQALQTLKAWKYKPYMYKGHAVEVETQITVRFEL